MCHLIRVGVLTTDELAVQVAYEFVGANDNPLKQNCVIAGEDCTVIASAKRTRIFYTIAQQTEAGLIFTGQIDLHPLNFDASDEKVGKMVVFSAYVQLCLTDCLDHLVNGFDWLIFSTTGNPHGFFTSSPNRVAACQVNHIYQNRLEEARAPKRLAIFGSIHNHDSRQRETQVRLAANHLGARISSGNC